MFDFASLCQVSLSSFEESLLTKKLQKLNKNLQEFEHLAGSRTGKC